MQEIYFIQLNNILAWVYSKNNMICRSPIYNSDTVWQRSTAQLNKLKSSTVVRNEIRVKNSSLL